MTSASYKLADALKQHYEKALLAVALVILAGVCVFMSGMLTRTKQDAGMTVRDVNQMRTNTTPYVRTNMAPAWSGLTRATNPALLGNGSSEQLFRPEK